MPLTRSFASLLRTPIKEKVDFTLYLIADQRGYWSEELFMSKIKETVKGGASCVQYRDYQSHFNETLRTAMRLKELLKEVPLFINGPRSFEIAKAVNAAGVFLEEPDMIDAARQHLGEKAWIGTTIKKAQDLYNMNANADYYSIKISPSKTCTKNMHIWDKEDLKKALEISLRPILAVGGLTVDTVEEVYKLLHPPHGLALSGGILETESPYNASRKIREISERIRNLQCSYH